MLETFYNDSFHKLAEGALTPDVFKFFASVWPSNLVNFYQVKSGPDKPFLALILTRPQPVSKLSKFGPQITSTGVKSL